MRRVLSLLLLCALASALSAATASDHLAAGRAALIRNENDKAVDLLTRSIALQPKNAEAHYLLGGAYGRLALKAGILKQASLARKTKNELERAVELDPKYLEARFALLDYYLIAPGIVGGGDDKAVAQAEAIKRHISPLDGHRAFARIYSHQKKPDLARKELVDAVRAEPASGKAHYFLGRFLLEEKNWTASLHELEMAIKLDASFMTSYYRIGQHAALSETNYARGEETLRKYLAYQPDENEPPHAGAWYWLGMIQEKQGKKADARQSYLKAQKLSPDDKNVKEALKRV